MSGTAHEACSASSLPPAGGGAWPRLLAEHPADLCVGGGASSRGRLPSIIPAARLASRACFAIGSSITKIEWDMTVWNGLPGRPESEPLPLPFWHSPQAQLADMSKSTGVPGLAWVAGV